MNTELYLIMKLLENVIPDDISKKILLLLLGISKTPCASCINNNYIRTDKEKRNIFGIRCGLQYEIMSQQTKMQEMVMCDIRIAQFDEICGKKKTPGAIKNIKRYMKTLETYFIQRFRFLYNNEK